MKAKEKYISEILTEIQKIEIAVKEGHNTEASYKFGYITGRLLTLREFELISFGEQDKYFKLANMARFNNIKASLTSL
jgi:hypothetical protein